MTTTHSVVGLVCGIVLEMRGSTWPNPWLSSVCEIQFQQETTPLRM